MSIFSRLFYLDEEQDALDFGFLKHKKDILEFISKVCEVIEIGASEGEENAAESLRDIFSTMEHHPASDLVISLLQRQREINDKYGDGDELSLDDSLIRELEIKGIVEAHGLMAKGVKSKKVKKTKKVAKKIAKISPKKKAKKATPKKAAKPSPKKAPAKKAAKPVKKGAKK